MTGAEIAIVLARGVHLGALLSLFGCLMFAVLIVPKSLRPVAGPPLSRVARISAGAAWIAGAAWLAAVAGTMSRADGPGALLKSLPVAAGQTAFGRIMCIRLTLLLAAALLCGRPGTWEPGRYRPVAAALTAGGGLALQPWLGHAGAMDGIATAVLPALIIAHCLAAGAWLGGLGPLLMAVARAPIQIGAAFCERFSIAGLVSVAVLALTAPAQSVALIGGAGGLFGTAYGQLALIKLGLFLVALACAAVNRFVLTAQLRRGSARRPMMISIGIETTIGLAIVLAAAGMGATPPAAHVQPVWPFPWRPSLIAWDEPEWRSELIQLAAAAVVAVALILGSLAARRWRVPACLLAVLTVAPFAPALGLLLVEANPASYATSPTGFSARSIVRGQALFGPHCAACHEPANGTGGAADLLAPHLWDHPDGDMFWRLSDGAADPRGGRRMPGFAPSLPAGDLWSLIDFVRARNLGGRFPAEDRTPPHVRAPAMELRGQGGEETLSGDLIGRVLLIGADRAASPVPEGAVTIHLDRAPIPPPPGWDFSAGDLDAWAVLAGVPPERFKGFLAIVDGDGWLRAWLPPGVSVEEVEAVVRRAQRPAAPGDRRPAGGHAH